ncbi:MAG: DMT family transporter [Pseudomonadota bacterium]
MAVATPLEAPSQRDGRVAAGFMLICAAAMALASLLAKALGSGAVAEGGAGLHAFQISAGRFLFGLLAVGLVAAIRPPPLRAIPWRLHVVRTTLGWLAATSLFAAAALMPLAEATAISFLNPVFTMLLAIPLLGERIGPWRAAGAAIALGGALLLLQPGAEALKPGALVALAAALFLSLEAIVIKRLSTLQPALAILLVNNTLGAVISLSVAIAFWRAPSALEWALMAGVSFSVVGAQVCFLQAMRRAEASWVAPFSYLTLVVAAILDYAVFGDLPGPVAMLGAVVLVGGALLIAWRDQVRARGPRA